jgi:Skp family chaperone for outer membrane proteins
MTLKTTTVRALGVAGILAIAGGAMAQTAPAGPPAGPAALPISHGPALANVCIFNNARAMNESTVGKFVQTRLNQIATEANAELAKDQKDLEAKAAQLDADSRSPTADGLAIEKRKLDLRAALGALDDKGKLRQAEVTQTRRNALGRIAQEMDPVLVQVYQQKQCSILLPAESVILANPAMDITGPVIAGTNAKIQQFTFAKERLDPRTAAPVVSPAATATPAAKPKTN